MVRRPTAAMLLALPSLTLTAALTVLGLDVPHARVSGVSRALDDKVWPEAFPYSAKDLTPMDNGNDGVFYFVPKFVQHAGGECRETLTKFYEVALPPSGTGAVLDLCSSWTSHYPADWKGERCVALGLNYLELIANPSKTEYKVQDLNAEPTLPFGDAEFDLITNSLSVDYMTQPLELFGEMHRVLKPGGYACMAFTNRCFPTKVRLTFSRFPSPSILAFSRHLRSLLLPTNRCLPTKIVPIWNKPFTEANHVQVCEVK